MVTKDKSTKQERAHWREIAVERGIKRSTYNSRISDLGWTPEQAASRRLLKHDEFAVYKGEDLIVMGSAVECAEFLNVTPEYIKLMTTPTGKKRLAKRKDPEKATTAVRLYDDFEE